MDVFIFALLTVILLGTALLTFKSMQLVAAICGIGIFMMALAVMSSGLEVQTGFNETVTLGGNHTERVVNYESIFVFFGGITFMKELLAVVIGGIGVLVLVYSVI